MASLLPYRRAGRWGYLHQRQNHYEAVLVITPVDGAWKLTGMDLRSEECI